MQEEILKLKYRQKLLKFLAVVLFIILLIVIIFYEVKLEKRSEKENKPYTFFKLHRNFFRDAILPSNNPPVVKANEAKHMKDDDIVIGIEVAGIARAYPRWFLVSYHVVNDTINSIPVLITQCEICSAFGAFYPVINKNKEFSYSFNLCESKAGTYKICDIQTGSVWHPFTGVAISGEKKGIRLDKIPYKVVKWKNWLRVHPNTDVVLSSQEQRERWHGHTKASDIGFDWIPPLIESTLKLDLSNLKRNDLVYGVLFNENNYVFPVKYLDKNSIVKMQVDQFNFIFIKGVDYNFNVFQVGFDDNFQIRSFEPLIIKSLKGGEWDEYGVSLPSSKIRENLKPITGYMTEWWEWNTQFVETKIAQLRE